MVDTSDNAMFWTHPAPDASAPTTPSGGYRAVTISAGLPFVEVKPVDKHLKSIRDEFTHVERENASKALIIAQQSESIRSLSDEVGRLQKQLKEVTAKLDNIKAHL